MGVEEIELQGGDSTRTQSAKGKEPLELLTIGTYTYLREELFLLLILSEITHFIGIPTT